MFIFEVEKGDNKETCSSEQKKMVLKYPLKLNQIIAFREIQISGMADIFNVKTFSKLSHFPLNNKLFNQKK